jgi:hypothetical protein
MKRIFKFGFMILFIFTACTKAHIVEDFRVATSYREGYKQFVVNYGNRLKDVRLQGIPIEAGKVYYVEPGEYTLTYEYIPKVSFNITMNYNKKSDDRNRDAKYMDSPQEKLISIYEDSSMSLNEKNMEVIIQGIVSN